MSYGMATIPQYKDEISIAKYFFVVKYPFLELETQNYPKSGANQSNTGQKSTI